MRIIETMAFLSGLMGVHSSELLAEDPVKIVVDFSAADSGEAWVAAAFEQNVYRDLSGFQRIAPVSKSLIGTSQCKRRAPICLVPVYAEAGIDIVMIGGFEGGDLDIDIYETWTGSQVSTGSFRIGTHSSLVQIRRETLRALNPFLASGGLIEQKPFLVDRASRTAPTFWARYADRILAGAGGLAWGWLALIAFSILFPRIYGIERIRHSNVWQLLKAWAYVSALRSLLLATVCIPFGWLVWFIGKHFSIDEHVMLSLVLPIAGLVLCFCFLILVVNLARYLDHALVEGRASVRNPWHPAIKKYFMGYVRRNGLRIDRRTLDSTLFLAGNCDGIVTYGGGLSRPRVVINTALLHTALGQAEEDTEPPPQTIGPDEWASGSVFPSGVDTDTTIKRKTTERDIARKRWAKERRLKPPSYRRNIMPKLIGQNETLLGYVVPLPADQTVPLISNDREDYGVVRGLLTEHYGAFERSSYEEESDDTDPTQKDFLFGAILKEIGIIRRKDILLASVRLSCGRAFRSAPSWMQKAAAFFWNVYQRTASRYPAIIADSYAALNLGRDHLIQYLFHLKTGERGFLTARADMPRLHSTSNEILRSIAEEETITEGGEFFRASLENRLVWLSQYFYSPISERRGALLKVAATGAVVMAIVAFLALKVRESIDYHPVYTDRMHVLTDELEKSQQQGKRDDVRHH